MYTETMDPRTGYLVYVASGSGTTTLTADLEGDLVSGQNLGNVNPGATFSNNTHSADGWNLIGNPYPSQIDWDDTYLSVTGSVNANAYVYDPGTSAYLPQDGNDGSPSIIASHQGFWVKLEDFGAGLEFKEENKTNATPTFYKTAADTGIVLTLTGYGNEHQTRIRFRPDATDNYDYKLDAYCLPSLNPDYPNLYTHSADGKSLVVNSVPDDFDNFSVPMGIVWNGYPPSVEEYFLAIRVDRLPPEIPSICLQDLGTGAAVVLEEGDGYTFMTDWSATSLTRFILNGPMVGCATDIGEQTPLEEQIAVIQQDGLLHITFALDRPAETMIRITNLLGQTVHTQTTRMQNGTLVIQEPQALTGAYLVTVVTPGLTVHKKLLKGM